MDFARRAFDWCLRSEGSTRSAALMRMGLAMVIWARWAIEVLLYLDLSPKGLVLSASFFLSTTLMFFGIFSRASTLFAGVVTLMMYHYFGLELGREPWTHHHTYVLAFTTLLCGLTPCGGSYSVDRWWALRKARLADRPAPPERANIWGVRLLALQMSTIYLFTAWDKTNVGFLSGDRMEHYIMWFYMGSEYPDSAALHAAMMVFSIGVVIFEYALGFGLLFSRTRKWLLIPGLLMHGAFYVLLPVSTYTATMWVLYLAYLDPDALHRFIERLSGHEA